MTSFCISVFQRWGLQFHYVLAITLWSTLSFLTVFLPDANWKTM
jgi:hypothetical protein